MAEYRTPGVTVSESLKARETGTTNSGIARSVIVGPTAQGPTVPTAVGNWSQFVELFGDWRAVVPGSDAEEPSKQMVDAAYTYFSNASAGASPLTVVRVLESGADYATKSVVDASYTGTTEEKTAFNIQAISPGNWGNNLQIVILKPTSLAPGADEGDDDAELLSRFSIVVKLDGRVLESHNYLTLKASDRQYCATVVNGFSRYIRLTDVKANGTHIVPGISEGSTTKLSGGSDGDAPVSSDYTDALKQLGSIAQPLTMTAPGISDTTIVNAVVAYGSQRGDAFTIISAPDLSPDENDVDSVQYWAAGLTKSSFAAVYYPDVLIADPLIGSSNITRSVSNAGSVLGAFADNDQRVGVWRTPAGTSAFLRAVVQPSRALSADRLSSLNSGYNPINVIRRVNTIGPCIMGGRTLDQRQSDRYVGIRRSLSFVRSSLQSLLEYALFEPNGPDLWADVTARLENFLGLYYQRGALRGAREPEAFYVTCDATNNPPSSVAAGELHVTVGVAVEYPAEFVIIDLVQHQESVRN